MKTRGAVLRHVPGQFEVADLELESPRSGELLVELVASGLCHSDDHFATGDIPAGVYPFCGGHEGSGVVVDVGPNTPGWQAGDHVVLAYIPACGHCKPCAQGRQNLCDLGANMLMGSRFEDTTSYRLSLDGGPVGQMCGISTFSEFTTVSANSAVKIDDKSIPLVPLCLIGCGVGTGWSSAVHAAAVQPNDTVIVMGVGGIGVAALQGSELAGARNIIAVDPVAFKRDIAIQFGATNACADMDEATELARSLTHGQGADKTIVSVGVTTGEHVGQGIESIRKGGTVVAVGAGPATVSKVSINLLEFTMSEKKLVGAVYGGGVPFVTVPTLVELYTAGKLKLDEMITRTYTLDQVAEGFRDMHAGRNIRGVVLF